MDLLLTQQVIEAVKLYPGQEVLNSLPSRVLRRGYSWYVTVNRSAWSPYKPVGTACILVPSRPPHIIIDFSNSALSASIKCIIRQVQIQYIVFSVQNNPCFLGLEYEIV